jgi:hypothetical protein
MKHSVMMALVLTLAFGTLLFADKGRKGRDRDRGAKAVEKEEAGEAEQEEEEVVDVLVVKGTKPFSVTTKQIVRLTGEGIAGSTAKIQITGKAKLEQTAKLHHLNDGQPLIGPGYTEFDIQPTAAGPVTAVITVTFPTGDTPKVTTYKFDVQ